MARPVGICSVTERVKESEAEQQNQGPDGTNDFIESPEIPSSSHKCVNAPAPIAACIQQKLGSSWAPRFIHLRARLKQWLILVSSSLPSTPSLF